MDFANLTTLTVGERDSLLVARWPTSVQTDDAVTSAGSVGSYAQALQRMAEVGADRLFVPAQVFGDMVRTGAGPDEATTRE